MGRNDPTAADSSEIRAATDRALNDATFQRSPVLSRLLDYLVDMTDRGQTIKSYTIAVDGLGRSDRDLSEADTYARVAVARLRKALSVYYAANPQVDELYIDTGSYHVRMRSNANAEALNLVPTAKPQHRRWRSLGRPYATTIIMLLASLGLAFAGIAFHRSASRQEQVWSTLDLPIVSVAAVQKGGASDRASDAAEIHRQALVMALSGYVGLRLVDDSDARSDFHVRIFLSSENSETQEIISLAEGRSGRVIWTNIYTVGSTDTMHRAAVNAASAMASPAGIIHSFARRSGYDAQTPYGCWLRFTEGVQTYNTLGDDVLADCAEDWYAVAKNRPLAAFLYGWSLTDKSVLQLRSASRKTTLGQALDVLHRASALNPDTAILHIAEMRAYSFLGDRRGALEAAHEAIVDARNNRVVIGMAASGMALWNDPQGEIILRQLHANENPPFPWEHVGLFVAAMMREDIAEAGKHISHLDNYESGQPLLLLLKGAFFARTGRNGEAEMAISRLKANPIIRIAGTAEAIERLPMAPEVKARLSVWMSSPARHRSEQMDQ